MTAIIRTVITEQSVSAKFLLCVWQ